MYMTKADILNHFSATTEEQAKRNLYKYTDCGAFIEFEEDGIVLGSIVEGSDNGTTTFHLKYGITKEDLEAVIEQIEQEADVIWKWVNEQGEDGKTDAEKGFDWPLL